MTSPKRKDPGALGQGATGAFKHIAGGECSEVTADTTKPQPRPLVLERGTVRRATLAELRRLARLGLIGGAA